MKKIFTPNKWPSSFCKHLSLILICLTFQFTFSQTTWTAIATPAPDSSGSLMILLSDGSVICKTRKGGGDGVGNVWNKLTPNINGSYINGNWSNIAPMNNTRLYCSTQTMKDGRIYFAGGEYGNGNSNGEIYDPISNTWTLTPSPLAYLADANSAILDDGRILQAALSSGAVITRIYNPITNTYINGPTCLGQHSEATWMKLTDNSILFVEMGSTNSERYIPSLNQWVADATVPVNLYDPYGYETGPAFLLPDGRAFFTGSLGNTAIYTPSGNNSPGSWVAGANIPGGNGCPDAAGAMLVDGKIIFTASPKPVAGNVFQKPTYFYEYDYTTNLMSPLTAPGGGVTLNDSAFNTNMLCLPDGNIMLSVFGGSKYYVHKPNGAPLAVGKPTITTVAQTGCANTFTLTGLLFNGITEGASFGDDWQMNTNFPIVRLTSGPNVYYARTHHWNHTGVRTGALVDTTLFNLSANIPNGTYSLCVIANGNASDPITFTFSPFPTLTSPLIAPDICTGNNFSYTAVANMTNTTVQWTRAAIAGISNAAITTAQSANPNEVLFNTSNIPVTVVYSYTLTNGGCTTYYLVSVVVNPNQTISILGNTTVCDNKQTSLNAVGAVSYTWSTGAFTSSITVSPAATTIYTVNGINSFGCMCTKQLTITVKPSPTLSIAGNQTICVGDSIVLTANSNGTSYYWNTGDLTNTLSIIPNTTTSYTVISYMGNGCQRSDSIKINVLACTGVKEIGNSTFTTRVYPNPFNDKLIIESTSKKEESVAIKIYDVFGRVVKEEESVFVTGNNKKEITLCDLAKGIYLLMINKDAEIIKATLIKD